MAGDDSSMNLFRHQAERSGLGKPLADRMRPTTLEQFFGQRHLVGQGKILQRALVSDRLPSMILWGPPGSGKTTLARVIAGSTGALFFTLSAVGAGVKDLREVMARAAEQRDLYGKRSILFIDEIHRFNKAQQDALLPHVERGTVVLVGATTENPSFEVISALLSRTRVLRLEPLEPQDLLQILQRALEGDVELRRFQAQVGPEQLDLIVQAAQGDARRALTSLEVAVQLAGEGGAVTGEVVEQALQRKTLLYDKQGEEHFNVISAFIKSMRGSDPDAAVYWMVRMLEAGEDPLFILRRMVIFASEDVGNADPTALQTAVAALDAVRFVGLPEGALAMTQAVTYLASACKSNSALTAYSRARKEVQESGPLAVPMKLRNAPTSMMQQMGYGKDYRYPHNFEGHYVAEAYLPEALQGRQFYTPSESGHEAEIAARLRGRSNHVRSAPHSGEDG